MDIIEDKIISYTDEEIEGVTEFIQCEGGNITARQVKNLGKAISKYPFVEDKYKMILLNQIARMKDATLEARTISKEPQKYYSYDTIDYVVKRGLSSLYDEFGEIPMVVTDDTLERRLAYLSEEIVVDSMLLDANIKSRQYNLSLNS